MSYTIIKSDGTVLTTIADGTINTTSTSAGLPGRNYAGYGQALDTNIVRQMENFAKASPPENPLRGQLWYNTNANTLYVCPSDGEANAAAWSALTTTTTGGATTFGAVTVTGNLQAQNITVSNNISALSGTFDNISVFNTATIGNVMSSALNGPLTTTVITTGAEATPGSITGQWIFRGDPTAISVMKGNLTVSNTSGNIYGIKCDNYMYANGVAFQPTGTYGNANVAAYLPTYTGSLQPASVTTSAIAGGGTISGIWTLGIGARINATYADLAERFAADAEYEPGTVVEIGGTHEITICERELSEKVFGVISNTAAYMMNSTAGDDITHPAVALSGRVHVKVTGLVVKGDRLVSAGAGMARAARPGDATPFNTLGRALEDKTDDGLGTINAVVIVK
jgi:hypothetical protein